METEQLSLCNLCAHSTIKPLDSAHNICICTSCGYVFDNPRPTVTAIAAYYSRNDKYDAWLSHEKGRDLLWQRRLKRVLCYKSSGILLDVGTGIGQFLSHAQKHFEVYGTEVSQSAIAIAKEKYGLSIAQGEIEKVPFNNTTFDCITLFHVLEHVPSPQSTLTRIKSLLKKDGILVIAVPNDLFSIRTFIIKMMRFLKLGKFKHFGKIGLRKLSLDGALNEIHLSHFKPQVLRSFLERNGFNVVKQTIDPYYSASGIAKIAHAIVFYLCQGLYRVTGLNIYPTQLIVVRNR